MIFKDYYRILELGTNRITKTEIKSSYRLLAKKYHPDKNINDKKAEERFKNINEAYRVLTDDSAKKKYDRIWTSSVGKNINKRENNQNKNRDSVFSEFFQMFFGEMNQKVINKQIPKKGDDIETEIAVSIEDAFYGLEKKISLKDVNGSKKTFSVKVPSGIRNNEKIRIVDQGKSGLYGGKNGDLLIKMKIEEDDRYKINGLDILTELILSPWEAALGTKVSILSLDGSETINIPAGMQSGEKIKIEQKGYKTPTGERGDLIVEAKIAVPKELTEEEKNLFEKMSNISKFKPRKS
jgi:DnaJ-class molecular chaperone with C-terminal Zn finger domain